MGCVCVFCVWLAYMCTCVDIVVCVECVLCVFVYDYTEWALWCMFMCVPMCCMCVLSMRISVWYASGIFSCVIYELYLYMYLVQVEYMNVYCGMSVWCGPGVCYALLCVSICLGRCMLCMYGLLCIRCVLYIYTYTYIYVCVCVCVCTHIHIYLFYMVCICDVWCIYACMF